ncbi:hypothetical protein C4D60_Mb10t12890 [Musa balbisiana]|uniref:Uncharacterized protein n=1 Tax=Musa balbisiana TaxID=52838 RepID=A0A4S8IZ56_MUSBA|nr:hypothetical protein C4D60_Mb10t12890 [Musa balbisiana]
MYVISRSVGRESWVHSHGRPDSSRAHHEGSPGGSATNLQGKMASNFVSKEDHHHQAPSRRGVRRTWSSNSSTCGQGAAAVPKCVCAPATHAGSFKCRLHRASSHGHSPPSPTSIRPPPPPANSSRAPTVEAQ